MYMAALAAVRFNPPQRDVGGGDRRDFGGPEQGVAHRAQERCVAESGDGSLGCGRGGRGQRVLAAQTRDLAPAFAGVAADRAGKRLAGQGSPGIVTVTSVAGRPSSHAAKRSSAAL